MFKQGKRLFILIIILVSLGIARQSRAQSDAADRLQDAWANTERAGSYDFTTELTETRTPAPRITSIGRSPQIRTIYAAGTADRRAEQLTLSLWDDPTQLHSDAASYDIEIDGVDARARAHGGQWEQIDDFSGSFAPSGDAAAFLSAAKYVESLGQGSAENPQRGTITYERYAFTLDGDAYANYLNEMLQTQMREQGQLPRGVSVTGGEHFRDMIGSGEAWIDENGLPLRMAVEMQFPQDRNGERLTMSVKTDFVGYNDTAAVTTLGMANALDRFLLNATANATTALSNAVPAFSVSAMLFALLAMAMVWQRLRPKQFYNSFATVLSAQMAFAPLASFADQAQMNRFLERFPSMQVAEVDETAAVLAQIAEVEDSAETDWQPLTTEQQTQVGAVLDGSRSTDVDSDNDGLSDASEASHCADPSLPYSDPVNVDYPACSNPNDADTDDDGLTDSEEYLYLGTYPNEKDSDGDGIWDHAEVRGFFDFAGDTGNEANRRYSNPLVADTDGDGRIDGVECPQMENRAWVSNFVCQNTDGADSADILDRDDDDDGVPSKLDLSPLTQWVPNGGHFDRDDHLDLTLSNVAANKPLLVDVQLRPTLPEQLSFALNYLDWPTGDDAGQVQRFTNSTFASATPGTPAGSPSNNGDMRVTPMLEVTLPANTLDLPRVSAETTFDLTDAGRIMGQFQLVAAGSNTTLIVPRVVGNDVQMTIRKGRCGDATLVFDATISSGSSSTISGHKLGDLANGGHIIELNAAGNYFCRPIPSLVEGMPLVAVTIQSTGQSLGQSRILQSGASDAVWSFPTLNGTFSAELHAAACDARTGGTLVASIADATSGSSTTVTGRKAVQIGDGNHSVTLFDSNGAVSCTRVSNIINGSRDDMIDRSQLDKYQISVHEGFNNEVVAMVPVIMTVDEVTGERVAFSGRMLFERSTTSDLNADINLIWVISALTDSCPDGDCSQGIIDQTQIIQTYRNEQWRVTGLSVEEELRYDMAVFYEDPTADVVTDGMTGEELANRSLEADDNLWQAVRGLQATFLVGSDSNNNNSRDYQIGNFKNIFENTPNDDVRFGIRQDALNVETYALGSQVNLDLLMNTHIPTILNDAFDDGVFDVPDSDGNPRTTVRPTLLFASESESRTLDLDETVLDGTPQVSLSDNAVTLNFDSGEVKPTTMAAMSWKPYQYTAGAWEAAPIDDYTERMKGVLGDSAEFIATTEEEEFGVIGELLLAEAVYLTYYLGRANAVQFDSQLTIDFDPSDELTSAQVTSLMNGVKGRATGVGGIVKGYVTEVALQLDFEARLLANMKRTGSPQQLIDSLDFGVKQGIGRAVRGRATEFQQDLVKRANKVRNGSATSRVRGAGGMAWMAATAFAGVAGGYFSPYSQDTGNRAVGISLRTMAFAGEVHSSVQLYQKFSAFKAANPGKGIGAFSKTLAASRTAKIAGAVGAAIAIGFSVGTFIYTAVSAELSFFGLTFNQFAANTIAAIALTVIMAVIATTGIGAIIVAIIGLIDALIALICGLAPPDPDNTAAVYTCKGISGLITELIAFLIYDQTDIVSVYDPNRLTPSLDMAIGDPALGFTPNANIVIDMDVVNSVDLESADGLLSGLYAWQFKDSNARKATFAYAVSDRNITEEEQQLHITAKLELNQHPNEWSEDDGTYAISRSFTGSVALGAAGINQPLNAHMVEAAATPVQECVMIPNPIIPFTPPAIPSCWIRGRYNTTYTDLNLQFDVFPTSLNQFYALVDKDGGKALAWGQDGDVTFPVLFDADGDGLGSGIDPDDGDADFDNDGVTDLKETQVGSNVSAANIDQDGLDDGDELHYGTDPNLPDTDGDGVTDGDEIAGWSLTYNVQGHTTRTWPDPLQADEDGDKQIDRVEKALGTNPAVAGNADVLAYETTLTETDAPILLLRFDEQTNAAAFFDSSGRNEALGATCAGFRCPSAGHLGQIGNAVAFDGSDDVLLLSKYPVINNLQNNFTIAAWINPDNVGQNLFHLFGTTSLNGQDEFGFLIFLSFLGLDLHGDIARGLDQSLQSRQWAHVAVSAETSGANTLVKFYINGELAGSETRSVSGVLQGADDPIVIGSSLALSDTGDKPDLSQAYNFRPYGGLLDELIVYDYVLDQTQIGMVRDGRYDVSDGIVTRNSELTFETTVANQLFGRTAQGLLQTELPFAVDGTPTNRNFLLSRNDGSEANTLNDTIPLTVKSNAVGGEYEIVQAMGAIIDEPQVPTADATANQVFHQEEVFDYNGTTDRLSFSNIDYLLGAGDYTIATWINPTTTSGKRGVLGANAGEIVAYPSLFVDDGKIGFGYSGTTGNPPVGGFHYRTTSSAYISPNEWAHVAVSFDASAKTASVYVDGDFKQTLSFTATPFNVFANFDIGRATAKFRVDFNAAEVKCEYDHDGPHYDLVYSTAGSSGNIWSQAFVDDVEETASRHVSDVAAPQLFTESSTVTLCENDYDDSNHNTCDGGDDKLGPTLYFNYYTPFSPVTNKTFTTGDQSCSFFDGYNDWIELDYTYDVYSLPFSGGVKDTRIIKRVMGSESEVLDLFQSAEVIAQFKLNDRPGATLFNNEVNAAVGACSGTSCPLTGVLGRENVAAEFDGVNDYIRADDVSELAAAAATGGNRGISFGGWFKPDNDFDDFDTEPYILAFNDSAGGNRQLLGLVADDTNGDAGFTVRVWDGSNHPASGKFSRGEWHHIFVTIDYTSSTDNATIYVNGIPRGTYSTTQQPDPNGRFSIGMEWDTNTPSDFFKGTVDEVLVLKRALADSSEVFDVMYATPTYNNKLEYADRYIRISNFQQINNCQPFCTKYLMVDGQASAELDLGVSFDVPIPGETTTLEVRVNNFLAGTLTIDESVSEGNFHWSDPFEQEQFDYTVYSVASTDPATLEFFEERPITTRGQIGDALEFTPNSVGSVASFEAGVTFPAVQPINDPYTVAVWVKPRDLKGIGDVYRPIVGTFDNGIRGQFFLGLKNGQPLVVVRPRNSGTRELLAPNEIPADVWTHIAVRYGLNDLTIFVNGSQAATLNLFNGGGYDGLDVAPTLGKSWIYNVNTGQVDGVSYFSGAIDELVGYRKALLDEEIAKLYNFQVAWQDEQSETPLIVDVAEPTVTLSDLPDFISADGQAVLITGQDDGSVPVAARLRIREDDLFNVSLVSDIDAPQCQDAENNTLFCSPTTGTLPEGLYYFDAAVIDAVGNKSAYDGGQYVVVDDSIPVDFSPGGTLPTAPFAPNQVADGVWEIPMSGTVIDELIFANYVGLGAADFAGSGIASVSIGLQDANGQSFGQQPASLNTYVQDDGFGEIERTDWAVDYELRGDNPTGTYTVTLTAVDKVGNTLEQVWQVIELDATDPTTTVDDFGVPGSSSRSGDVAPFFLNANTDLRGTADEQTDSAETHNGSGISGVQIALDQQFTHGAPQNLNALSNNARLFLPLDRSQAEENVTDASFIDIVGGSSATCSGVTCPLTGVESPNGQSAEFDGVDDVLEVTPSDALNGLSNDFTVAAWIKTTSTGSFNRIISTDREAFSGGFGMGQWGDKLIFTTYGVRDYVTSGSYITPGAWQHVAVHMTASNDAAFYVNGKLVETVTHSSPAIADVNTRLLIGSTTDTGVSGATIQHFRGSIDSPALLTGAPSAGDWLALLGMQPTLHLPFDARSFVDGGGLHDASGLGNDIALDLHTEFDDNNRSATGIVGSGALRFAEDGNGVTDVINITTPIGVLPGGNDPYSVTFWAKFDESSVNNSGIISIGDGANGNIIRFAGTQITFGTHNNYQGHIVGLPANEWIPFAFVWNGQQRIIYANGAEVNRITPSGANTLDSIETAFELSGFKGSIDDLRLYRRGLTVAEMETMAQLGWRDAVVNSRAASSSDWSSGLPDGIEGVYDLSVRGVDAAGNVDEEPQPTWTGIVDTVPPEVYVTEIAQGGGAYIYSIFALDFAVDEASVNVPAECGNITTTLRETNNSPWVLSIGDQLGTPFELVTAYEMICDTAAQLPADAILGICDRAGNCVYQNPDGTVVPTAVSVRDVGVVAAETTLILIATLLGLVTALFLTRRRKSACH